LRGFASHRLHFRVGQATNRAGRLNLSVGRRNERAIPVTEEVMREAHTSKGGVAKKYNLWRGPASSAVPDKAGRPVRLSMMLVNRSAPPATVTPVLVYEDVRAAVAWLESAFAFGERVRIGDGHRAQLRVGSDGAVVVAEAGADRVAPSGGGVTHIVKVRVPDVDAAFARARGVGARVVEELTTWEYGERSGVVEDLGGHRWELTQTVRDVAPEEWGGATIAPW
jgi:uncharacterized glyoxalase superfamily protein PhnB